MKIGIASFAHMHAHSYANSLLNLPGVDLVAIFDDQEERGQEAAKQYKTKHIASYEKFLQEEMDAIIVCSENIHHKEMVIQAAKAKKHILCEKPIATNLEDAQDMVKVCEDENVTLQIAYPVRFSTPIRELKTLIDSGELGDIVAFRTTNRGQNPGSWFIEKDKSGGGAVLDHTVHMVDIMRWFLGVEVEEVKAHVDSYFYDLDTDDAGLLTLQFENGVIASHDASWSRFDQYPVWGDVTIEVIGTKKTVKVDAIKEHLRLFTKKDQVQPYKHHFFGNDMDFGLVKDFVERIKEGSKPSITGYDGIKSLEVSLAAYESSKKNVTVKL